MFEATKDFFENKKYKNPYLMKNKTKSFFFKLFRLLFIIGLSYLFLFPLLYMIVTAFQDPATANDPSVIWIPKKLSLAGVVNAWYCLRFSESATLTAIITLFGTGASVVSCAMVGYGFARFEFPLKNVIFILVILTIIVPSQTIIMSQYLNYWFFDFGGILKLIPGLKNVNLLNTAWVFVLPAIFATGLRNGLFIFIFRQFFSGQPKDLEEAARIDGCGPFKTFIRIMVPLAGPACVTVIRFSVVWHWNDYYNSAIYFTNDIKPVSCMLSNLSDALSMGSATMDGKVLFDRNTTRYAIRMYLMAGTMLSVLPPLLLYLFTQKFFTESIERTGLVG